MRICVPIRRHSHFAARVTFKNWNFNDLKLFLKDVAA